MCIDYKGKEVHINLERKQNIACNEFGDCIQLDKDAQGVQGGFAGVYG